MQRRYARLGREAYSKTPIGSVWRWVFGCYGNFLMMISFGGGGGGGGGGGFSMTAVLIVMGLMVARTAG